MPQELQQQVQQKLSEMVTDLPTAKTIFCSLGELVKEMEDEEKEASQEALEKRDPGIGIGIGCDIWECK